MESVGSMIVNQILPGGGHSVSPEPGCHSNMYGAHTSRVSSPQVAQLWHSSITFPALSATRKQIVTKAPDGSGAASVGFQLISKHSSIGFIVHKLVMSSNAPLSIAIVTLIESGFINVCGHSRFSHTCAPIVAVLEIQVSP